MSKPKLAAEAVAETLTLDPAAFLGGAGEASSKDLDPRQPPAEEPIQEKDPDEGFFYVMDLSATPNSGERSHDLLMADGRLRPFKFTYDAPTRLPFAIAVRFLKNEGFIRTDRDGEEIPFVKVAKRPEDLEAGERLVIGPAEVVARYEELTNDALTLRAAMLPGSELVVQRGPREAVIDFIVAANAKRTAERKSAERDHGADEFTPPPETDF